MGKDCSKSVQITSVWPPLGICVGIPCSAEIWSLSSSFRISEWGSFTFFTERSASFSTLAAVVASAYTDTDRCTDHYKNITFSTEVEVKKKNSAKVAEQGNCHHHPWIRPHALFSQIFYGLLLGWTLWIYMPNLKFVALRVPEIIKGTGQITWWRHLWRHEAWIDYPCGWFIRTMH